MSYVRLTDAQTAYKHQVNQDDMRQLRDNQDDHEARIAQLLAQSQNAIVDDFFSSSGGAGGVDVNSIYEVTGTSAGFDTMMASSGDHVIRINTVATAATKVLQSRLTKCSFRLNQDMVGFLEARVQDIGGAAPDNMIVGYNDTGVATPATEANCIGFFKGTAAGKWRFRVAKGGVPTQTDNIGNRAAWQKLRMEFTRSGGGATLQVRAYIDGAEISGSPFTTNIPDSVVLRLMWGAVTPAAGTTDYRMDRWEHRWTAIPVNS